MAARRQGGPRPPGGGGLPGHLRQGELLRRGDGPRPVDREEDQAGAAGDRQGPRHPAAGHQRPALHAQGGRAGPRRAPVHPDRLAAERDQPLPLQRRRLLPEELRGDARAVRRHARGLRQHAAGRRAVRGDVHRGRRPHAPVPAARGRGRDLLVREGGRARAAQALADRHPRPRAQAGRLRGRDHHADGLPGVLPRGRRLHQLGQGPGHPRRPRPWLGRRLAGRLRDGHHRPRPAGPRPDLRAVPQPRARLHARRRHRLRRPPPRRGHPVRVGEVRRGAGQPDRHLRDDQGQGRDQGRRPRARPPVLGRRRADQAHAPGRHGQGHPAVGDLRPGPRALQGGRGVPGPLRVRPGRRRGRRPGPQARGPEAAVGRARRRRDHRPAPADRQRADHAPRVRRRGDHAVRLPDLRDARPAQDGLPGPAQPHRHRRRAAQHRDQRQGADRPRRDQQGPHRQGHLRPAGPR